MRADNYPFIFKSSLPCIEIYYDLILLALDSL